ncbi:MAG: hypothetical protein M1465_02635 [Candidatus Marsarchaeota archaeon]|jgi:hypothetical protein|nr:hypothetical protein [Candidatus Marsarchaeota archaeon]
MPAINEAKLIQAEIKLRNLLITKEVTETRRSMVRWLALSLGIINPGETRLSAIHVLDAMLYFQFQKKHDPNVSELAEYISKSWQPINEKTLRYHLLQLKSANIMEHSKGRYFMLFPEGSEKYDEEAWIRGYFESEISPIREKITSVIREIKKR